MAAPHPSSSHTQRPASFSDPQDSSPTYGGVTTANIEATKKEAVEAAEAAVVAAASLVITKMATAAGPQHNPCALGGQLTGTARLSESVR